MSSLGLRQLCFELGFGRKSSSSLVVSTQKAERQEDLARYQETKWLQFMEKQDKDALRLGWCLIC